MKSKIRNATFIFIIGKYDDDHSLIIIYILTYVCIYMYVDLTRKSITHISSAVIKIS